MEKPDRVNYEVKLEAIHSGFDGVKLDSILIRRCLWVKLYWILFFTTEKRIFLLDSAENEDLTPNRGLWYSGCFQGWGSMVIVEDSWRKNADI